MNQSFPEEWKRVPTSLQPKQIYPFQTATFPAFLASRSLEKCQSEPAARGPDPGCFCVATECKEGSETERWLKGVILVHRGGGKKQKEGVGRCEDAKDLWFSPAGWSICVSEVLCRINVYSLNPSLPSPPNYPLTQTQLVTVLLKTQS